MLSEACGNPQRCQNHGFRLVCCAVLGLSNTERLQKGPSQLRCQSFNSCLFIFVRDARENGELQQPAAETCKISVLLLGILGPRTESVQDGRVNFADFVNLLK